MDAVTRRLLADIYDGTPPKKRRIRKQNYGWSLTAALLLTAAAVLYFAIRSV